ncbi:MAG TPA: thiamine-phosphate kinase, partial [Acidobacteriota bacterium]|nr:thiamine-phosphate kinase [Acidobacteriota bacterium]
GGDKYELMTVDVLIEGVHFRREYVPAYYVGRKGLKISLSDIFAMGGVPLYCLISLGIPPDTSVRMIEEIYDGLSSIAGEAKVVLAGGNVSSSPVLFLDVVLIGEVEKKSVLFRNRARPGDSIFVTGFLGSAGEGLKLLRDGFRLLGEKSEGLVMPTENHDSRYVREAILSHIDPPLLHRVARALAKSHLVRSMIDLSDGVASDLTEVCRESNVGAVIEIGKLPISPAALYWERKRNSDPASLALQGGEDYHLLLTCSQRNKKRLLEIASRSRFSLFEIGRIQEASEGMIVLDRERHKQPMGKGFEHFKR